MAAGADFVKTSTGFGPSGATVEDVRLMRQTVGEIMGVKASGGARNLDTVFAMIDAGATRIGTSSGVSIMKELTGDCSDSLDSKENDNNGHYKLCASCAVRGSAAALAWPLSRRR